MKKPLLTAALLGFGLVACSQPTPEVIQEVVVVTATSEPATVAPEPTLAPETPPTNTPVPSPTPPPPTNTSEPTPPPDPSTMFARNYLGSVESAGVTMEVVRVLVGDVAGLDDLMSDMGGWDAMVESVYSSTATGAWENAEGAFEVIVRFTNNGTEPVDMYFDCRDSNAQIGSYQVNIDDVSIPISGYADMCFETLWPQASVFSGFWAPLSNLTPDDVTSMILRIEPPTPQGGYEELGPWFILDIDLSDHRWEEIPEEVN